MAYAVAQAGATLDVARLRAALAERLPDYMVPAAWMLLDALPLNANGKVDRKALPAPEHVATAWEAPQGEAETVLAAAWAAVLGGARIGRHDNFFELGGDSILSLQIVARLRDAGWQVTPRQVFERPSVAELAAVVVRGDAAPAPAPAARGRLQDFLEPEQLAALALDERAIEDVFPLAPTQEGMLFHSLEAAGTGLYVSQLSVEVRGLDAERLVRAWQAMVERHAVLRTGFLWQSGLARPLQLVWRRAGAPVTRLDWRGLDDVDARLAAHVAAELRREFDFAAPPLARLSLIHLDDDRHQLVWTQHHILLDGWGDSMLIGDWLRHYGGEALPAPGPGYGEYVRWLARQDAAVTEAFWKAELASLDGPTLAGRPPALARAQEMLGLFINTLPVAVARRPAQPVGEYLRALQATNLREHEHTALADIQRWLGSAGRALFDSIVVFENYPIDAALRRHEDYGLRFGEVASEGLTGYAIDLQVKVGATLEIEYCYDRGAFDDAFVRGLRRHLEHLLTQLQADPRRPLGELEWLDADERAALFALGRNAAAQRSAHPPVHRRIEAHAAAQPAAIAYNRYLHDARAGAGTPATAPCLREPWVTAIAAEDVFRRMYAANLAAGYAKFIPEIVNAAPGAPALVAGDLPLRLTGRVGTAGELGSNAIAFGRAATGTDAGVLFGNPHWYWGGPDRFYQAHLTIPGRLNVAGAAFLGIPVIMIGFNEQVA